MNPLDTAVDNLTAPMVLAFALGAVAALSGSDLRFPKGLTKSLSIYLLLAIGLKGGVALRETSPSDLWAPAVAALALGVTIPVVTFLAARRVLALGRVDAAALAAHYGSVSAVTYAASVTLLTGSGLDPEGFMPTLLALLEVPGIIVALMLAGPGRETRRGRSAALREVFSGQSVVLLVGGIAIGAIAGGDGYSQVEPFFGALFFGMLTLFLLDLGVVAANRARDLPRSALRIVPFGVLFPLPLGAAGVSLGLASGLSPAGATVLGAMAASASYIAAPAAVRIALPDANPGIYLTAAVAVTFPFNLVVGIPVYHLMATALS